MVIKNVFQERFEPEDILFRKEQISRINENFQHFREHKVAPNCMLTGRTGTGKTATIKYALRTNPDIKAIYTSGSTNGTTLKILRFIANSSKMPFERAIQRAIDNLNEDPRIIIIDEVNKIKDLKDFFDMLNTLFRETGVPIITITNRPKMSETMEIDARKTLLFERIDFKQYDANQLYEIIKSRLNILNGECKEITNEESLRFISAKCARDGSAREALNIVFRCYLKKDFSPESINIVEKNIEEEEWIEYVNSLRESERNFLRAMLDIYGLEKEITPKELQKRLNLTNARISQLLKFFEKEIIDIEYVYYRGEGAKKGRYAKINFASHDIFTKLEGIV